MSFKEDQISRISLEIYHDVSDIKSVSNKDVSVQLTRMIRELIKVSGLDSDDKITVLKNITLRTIFESTNEVLDYMEKEERSKMEKEFK